MFHPSGTITEIPDALRGQLYRTMGNGAGESANCRIQLLDSAHELIARIDVHTSILVAETGFRSRWLPPPPARPEHCLYCRYSLRSCAALRRLHFPCR